jgi:orotate phosphoribosyltransferase
LRRVHQKESKISTQNKILTIFEESGALLNGHFMLTSGLHSQRYFQCALVLQYPYNCHLLAEKIVTHFKNKKIDVVISPAIGGMVVGQEVGRQLGVRTIFAERKDGKMQLRRGFSLSPGEKVLICEDVVTTGGSVFEVIDIAKQQGAEIAGVGFIVDRSDGAVKFSVSQYSVIQLATEAYLPEDCPMCREGQPIQKPGSRQF